jgi:hypothetical protein
VLAVAGHMHDVRRGKAREALRYAQRAPVLNACRVPRLERRNSALWRWDYRAELASGAGLQKLERTAWVAGEGIVSRESVLPIASADHAQARTAPAADGPSSSL